jgi:hypothetical protein
VEVVNARYPRTVGSVTGNGSTLARMGRLRRAEKKRMERMSIAVPVTGIGPGR